MPTPLNFSNFISYITNEENLKELSKAIDIDLELVEQNSQNCVYAEEVASDECGDPRNIVIGELNAATPLDTLIHYAAKQNAQVVIWVATDICAEQVQAIQWLNEHIDSEQVTFYLVKLEFWKTEDACTVPQFSVEVWPYYWSELVFWHMFTQQEFDKDDEFSHLFSKPLVVHHHSYDLATKNPSCYIRMSFNVPKNCLNVGAYIHANKDLFHRIKAKEEILETMFESTVNWKEMNVDGEFSISLEDCPSIYSNVQPEDLIWIKDTAVKLAKFLESVDKS